MWNFCFTNWRALSARIAYQVIIFAVTIGGCLPWISCQAGNRALLVGVSHYPHLGDRYQLLGPENDIGAMRDLLIQKFSFVPESITILSEDAGRPNPSLLPTRANIEREFLRLGKSSAEGDHVVVFMAGHGAQQPEQQEQGHEPETDGLDEIFLPRDVDRWQQAREIVPNAIVDNEIAKWLKPVQANNARVWLLFDCCHSGDMSRGSNERERYVDPIDPQGLGIPADAFRASYRVALSRAVTAGKTGGRDDSVPPIEVATLDNLAVFYACQSHEKAIELPFPSKQEEKHFGLLTYSLKAVLSKARRPMSYRELSRQIYREYVAVGRLSGPTPLAEGADLDSVVLGKETMEQSQINITLDSGDESRRTLRINAGRLRGVSTGSVLAVYSQQEEAGDAPLGHVRVTDVDMASSTVIPWGMPKKTPKSLAGGRCEIVEVDYGDLRLPVSVDRQDDHGQLIPAESRSKLESVVRELSASKGSLIAFEADPTKASWFVRMQKDAIILISSRVASRKLDETSTADMTTSFGPFPLDERLPELLRMSLNRIARVENLMRLASTSDVDAGTRSDAGRPRIRVDGVVKEGTKTISIGQRHYLKPGNILDMRVTNVGEQDLDLTVLYVNSQMGITVLFPGQNNINRIRSQESRDLPLAVINAGPYGRNHFLFIALASEGQPADLTWLAQETLPKTRSGNTPLDALLDNALFGHGGSRSSNSKARYCMDILPIEVKPSEKATP